MPKIVELDEEPLIKISGDVIKISNPGFKEVYRIFDKDDFAYADLISLIKNQNRSSTCWAYSALGFLEAELLRLNKGDHDFSEMFVVYHTMLDRAVNYVRLHGDASFSPGGSFYDVLYCWRHYGIVPDKEIGRAHV